MAESVARKYVEGLADPQVRNVLLSTVIEVEPTAPKIVETPFRRPLITFQGRIVSMTVTEGSDPGGALLTTLDPAAEAAPVAATSPPASPAGGGSPSTAPPGQSTTQPGQTDTAPPQDFTKSPPAPHSGIAGKTYARNLAKCTDGSGLACDQVGFELMHGWGVDRNLPAAKQFYQKSCSMGSRMGCFDAKHFAGS
jgi:hypothetical protein